MQRWAEPLKSGISRVLAEDLARQLGQGRVCTHQEQAAARASSRLYVDVQRFEAVPGQGVDFQAAWILRGASNVEPRTGQFQVHEKAGEGYQDLAAAYSRALAAFSAELAPLIPKEPAASR